MTASASLATECRSDAFGNTVTRARQLRSQAPLILRPIRTGRPQPLIACAPGAARIALASGAAGPLGGDQFVLNIHVGAGSTLVLSEISATLLLPGARGGQSQMRIAVVVEDDATLIWQPEPVIAAHGCDHQHTIDVDLAASARLLMRDELLLGRHREQPGKLFQNIRIQRSGRPLFHQQLQLGPGFRGWASPAVARDNKCIGTVFVVDPEWHGDHREGHLFGHNAGIMPLAGPAIMVSVLGADTVDVRRLMRQGLEALDVDWSFAYADAVRADDAASSTLQPQPEFAC